jgi:hypothetical protein
MTRLAAFLLLAMLACSAAAQTVQELRQMLDEQDATILQLRLRIEALQREIQAARAGPGARREKAAEDEQERALERTLVRQGGLVLPPGTYELEPGVSHAWWDETRTSLRHETAIALTLRAGLPWDSQFQASLPYLRVRSATDRNTAAGDVSVGFSKQLMSERGARPGLVASVGWVGRTGDDGFDGRVPTGSGFSQLQGGLTAIKRRDPLVLYGGLTYAAAKSRDIEDQEIAPGNALGLRMGGILAASPHTSVNLGLNLAFAGATRIDGQRVPDSDARSGTLQIGVGMILTRRLMLNLGADIRVTGTAPDLRLSASLPIRF